MKKIIAILFMLAMLGTTAFATGDIQTSYDFDVDNNTVTITGKTAPNQNLLVIVLKPRDAADLLNAADYTASLAAARGSEFFASKKAAISVLLKNGDTNIDDLNFDSYRSHFVYETSGADGTYEVELPITFDSEDALYLLMADGGSYANDYQALSMYVPSSTTVTNAKNAVNGAATAADLITAIDTYDVVFCIDTNNDVYREMKQEIAAAILKMRTTAYTNFNDFKDDFAEALAYYTRQTEAMSRINVATVDSLKTYLETYSADVNVLGTYGETKLDFNTPYTKYGYYEVNKDLVGVEYDDMAAFVNAFKYVVSQLDAAATNPTPGTPANPTTPSGPKGNGGNGGGFTVPTTQIPVVEGADGGFTDLDQAAWAEESILNLVGRGVVNGMGDGTFNPNGNVTREQFVKMLLLSFGIDATTTSGPMSDVDASAWYAPYVNTAYELGIVNGVSDTEFGVGMSITRQDLVTMIVRACDVYGFELTKNKSVSFTDEGSIAGYAYDAVKTLAGAEIVNGVTDGVFAPTQNATRAQVSVMLDRLYNM